MNWDYPELYYRIYPKIMQILDDSYSDNCYLDSFTEMEIEYIVEDVYKKMVKECPEMGSDPMERRGRCRSAQNIFYGRGRLVRDLIRIFLISELLRRSRFTFTDENPYYDTI